MAAEGERGRSPTRLSPAPTNAGSSDEESEHDVTEDTYSLSDGAEAYVPAIQITGEHDEAQAGAETSSAPPDEYHAAQRAGCEAPRANSVYSSSGFDTFRESPATTQADGKAGGSKLRVNQPARSRSHSNASSVSERDGPLPEDWEKRTSPDGMRYYLEKITGHTTRVRPPPTDAVPRHGDQRPNNDRARPVATGPAPIQEQVNGSDSDTASSISSYHQQEDVILSQGLNWIQRKYGEGIDEIKYYEIGMKRSLGQNSMQASNIFAAGQERYRQYFCQVMTLAKTWGVPWPARSTNPLPSRILMGGSESNLKSSDIPTLRA